MQQLKHGETVENLLFVLRGDHLDTFSTQLIGNLEIVLRDVLVDVHDCLLREALPFDYVFVCIGKPTLTLIYYLLNVHPILNEYDILLFQFLKNSRVDALAMSLLQPGNFIAHLGHDIVVICHPLFKRELILLRCQIDR